MLIRSIQTIARGTRVQLDVGADQPVELAAVVCPPLRKGDDVDAATLAALVEATREHDVREAALHLLSYRQRSNRELRDRLLRKGYEAERIDRCLDGLRGAGLIDDAAFSESHARDAVRLRPRGRRRIVGELRRKGVDETIAVEAVQRVMVEEATPENDLALRAAEGWFRRAGDDARALLCGRGDRAEVERVRRRFWGFMARRGFGPDTVRAALEGVCR